LFEEISKEGKMGGLGSGRWKKQQRTMISDCPLLDINHLAASGCLQPGYFGVFRTEAVSIYLRAEPERRSSGLLVCLGISAALAPVSFALEIASPALLVVVGGG
jgi:hypothetical protein